jgi:hypothetical protein
LQLVVQGRDKLYFEPNSLPLTVRVSAGTSARYNLIGISGGHSSHRLPAEEWFSLAGAEPNEKKLVIDVEPHGDGDRWSVTVDDKPLSPAYAAPAVVRSLKHLILIFDRTCPSEGRWSDALNVSLNGVNDETQNFMGPNVAAAPVPGANRNRPAVAQYNRELRDALSEAFQEEFAAEPIYVDVIWFADDADAGMAWVPGLADLKTSIGDSPDCMSSSMRESLDGLTFSPGLDVWDPLESALEIAAEKLDRLQVNQSAVLIVGNSPPNPPISNRSPLWNVLRLDNGRMRPLNNDQPYTSTFRHGRRPRFDEVVVKIQNRVPLVYIFLKHLAYSEDHQREFDYFRQVQQCILTALQSYMYVEAGTADRNGIRTAFHRAAEIMRRPMSSLVRVER